MRQAHRILHTFSCRLIGTYYSGCGEKRVLEFLFLFIGLIFFIFFLRHLSGANLRCFEFFSRIWIFAISLGWIILSHPYIALWPSFCRAGRQLLPYHSSWEYIFFWRVCQSTAGYCIRWIQPWSSQSWTLWFCYFCCVSNSLDLKWTSWMSGSLCPWMIFWVRMYINYSLFLSDSPLVSNMLPLINRICGTPWWVCFWVKLILLLNCIKLSTWERETLGHFFWIGF